MVICPIANVIGCHKCAIVNFCALKSVLGNYDDEQTETAPDDSESTESKPPD